MNRRSPTVQVNNRFGGRADGHGEGFFGGRPRFLIPKHRANICDLFFGSPRSVSPYYAYGPVELGPLPARRFAGGPMVNSGSVSTASIGVAPGNRLAQVIFLRCSIPRAAVLSAMFGASLPTERREKALMNDHKGCERCKRLIEAWRTAVFEFSGTLSRLPDAHRDGNGFEQAHRETEISRQSAENARMKLDQHRYGHE